MEISEYQTMLSFRGVRHLINPKPFYGGVKIAPERTQMMCKMHLKATESLAEETSVCGFCEEEVALINHRAAQLAEQMAEHKASA